MKKNKEMLVETDMDSTGKLATRLSELDDSLATNKKERETVAEQLGEVLKLTGRTRIQLADRVYVIKETKASQKIVALKVKPASDRAATHASKTEKE